MRPPAIRIHSDELIVDNFAGGGGASLGIEWGLGRSPDIAVNHDREAIAMHQANHPGTRHFCEDVWKVDPKVACGGRKVALAWFSPDCKHFSKAKGGKPVEKNIRGLAWVVTRWAKAVRPRVIFLENVEEFQDWGPLLDDGRPDAMRRGLTFRRWLGVLRNAGYDVEVRELRACDYGAPTSRRRLFIIARSDGLPIIWPKTTHGPGRASYRTAADCIEWMIPCPSIFERKRPLAENTQRRIARGIRKYVIDAAEPFLVHRGNGERPGQAPRIYDIERPHPTVVAGGIKTGLVTAFLARHYSEREPYVRAGKALDQPVPTVTTSDHHSLVTAFLARHYGGHENDGSAAQMPMFTVTTKDHHALVASHLLKLQQNSVGQDHRAPFHTVMAGATRFAAVRAFLVKYYGTEQDPQLGMPLHTVTTKDRFGLVTVRGEDYAIADIGMRMLVPRELFRAQGFPDSYKIEVEVGGKALSKGAQVRMCGNSVCPPIAAALVAAQFAVAPAVERVA